MSVKEKGGLYVTMNINPVLVLPWLIRRVIRIHKLVTTCDFIQGLNFAPEIDTVNPNPNSWI